MNLHMQHASVVRTENVHLEPEEFEHGVRHVCILSPLLFWIYAEIMMVVWNAEVFYVSKTWTLKKYERDRLEAFVMWTWWNMNNIRWNITIQRKLLNIVLESKKTMTWTHIDRRKPCKE